MHRGLPIFREEDEAHDPGVCDCLRPDRLTAGVNQVQGFGDRDPVVGALDRHGVPVGPRSHRVEPPKPIGSGVRHLVGDAGDVAEARDLPAAEGRPLRDLNHQGPLSGDEPLVGHLTDRKLEVHSTSILSAIDPLGCNGSRDKRLPLLATCQKVRSRGAYKR